MGRKPGVMVVADGENGLNGDAERRHAVQGVEQFTGDLDGFCHLEVGELLFGMHPGIGPATAEEWH